MVGFLNLSDALYERVDDNAPELEATAPLLHNYHTGSLRNPHCWQGSLLDGNIIVCHANTRDADQRPFARLL
jgi:hypothetical protein